MKVPVAVRRLGLALSLIAAASAVLVLSDPPARSRASRRAAKIAMFQFSPHPLLDEFVAGARAGLAHRGYSEPDARMDRFNADGDVSNAAAIARELTGGSYDLVLTCTTPCLQAVARANGRGKALHVFGLVTDPFVAGIGLDRKAPQKHPPYLVGSGSLQPVFETFQIAKELDPSLTTVGTVWNAGEANSEVCIRAARAACTRLGLELVEVNAESPNAVLEAAASLVPRGIEAIYVGGDNVAINAIASIVQVARRAKIPVFTSQPGLVKQGSLFDLGPDTHELGRLTGDLAARVLSKEVDPASLPIQNLMPKLLLVAPDAIEGLNGSWRFPAEVLARADGVAGPKGVTLKKAPQGLGKQWRIRLIHYSDAPFAEDAQVGLIEELGKSGLVPERDYELTIRSAHGDVATVAGLVHSAESERVDLLIVTSTPTLQAVAKRITKTPVVFTVVADPILAGVGKTYEDHLPNITGVATTGDYGRLVEIVHRCLPRADRVGTLFVPSEVNSVFNKERVEEEARKLGITLVSVPVETSGDVANAAHALVGKDLDAILQIPGNLTASAFASIAQAAASARLPVFSYVTKDATMGSIVAVSRDYEQAGRDAALLSLRIIRGESPAKIPFQLVSRSTVTVNLAAAQKLGIEIPESVRREADAVIRE